MRVAGFLLLVVAPLFASEASRADCINPYVPSEFESDTQLLGFHFGNAPALSTPQGVFTTRPGGVWLLDGGDDAAVSSSDPDEFCDPQPPVDVVTDDPKFWLVRAPADAAAGTSFRFCEAHQGEWPWYDDHLQPGCACALLYVREPINAGTGIGFALSERAPLAGDFQGCESFHCSFPIVELTLDDDVDPTNVVAQIFYLPSATPLPGSVEPDVVAFFPSQQVSGFIVETTGTIEIAIRLLRLSDGTMSASQTIELTGEYDPGAWSCTSQSTAGVALSAAAAFLLLLLGRRRTR